VEFALSYYRMLDFERKWCNWIKIIFLRCVQGRDFLFLGYFSIFLFMINTENYNAKVNFKFLD